MAQNYNKVVTSQIFFFYMFFFIIKFVDSCIHNFKKHHHDKKHLNRSRNFNRSFGRCRNDQQKQSKKR